MEEPDSYTPKVDVYKWRDEVAILDSMIIDGDIRYWSTKKDILRKFGKPTRTAYVNKKDLYLIQSSNEYVEQIYYGATCFEQYEKNYVVRCIDFERTNVVVKFPEITLYKGMNIREVCKRYPESCKLALPGGAAWSGDIQLRISKYGLQFERVVLVFLGEELRGIKILDL